jgi:uncharacterized protein (DUF433 family)
MTCVQPKRPRLQLDLEPYEQPAFMRRLLSRTCYLLADGSRSCNTCVRLKGVEVKTFTRITVDPNQMGGLPCIRGLRIPVATVVGMIGEGMAEAEILTAYPDLEVEDVREALRYAAEAVRERELPVVGGS